MRCWQPTIAREFLTSNSPTLAPWNLKKIRAFVDGQPHLYPAGKLPGKRKVLFLVIKCWHYSYRKSLIKTSNVNPGLISLSWQIRGSAHHPTSNNLVLKPCPTERPRWLLIRGWHCDMTSSFSRPAVMPDYPVGTERCSMSGTQLRKFQSVPIRSSCDSAHDEVWYGILFFHKVTHDMKSCHFMQSAKKRSLPLPSRSLLGRSGYTWHTLR